MNEKQLSNILDKGISSQSWPYLQVIVKDITNFIDICIQKREYIEAQRAKERLFEVSEEMKKRAIHGINMKEEQSIMQMVLRHQEEKEKMEKEILSLRRRIEAQFDELILKKKQKQHLQRQKQLQQIQIALPLQQSPDKLLFKLRQEQQELARTGNFIEAQRVKVQIAKKQQQLNKKAMKLRQANIKVMMGQLETKQKNQMMMVQSRRMQKLQENEKLLLRKEKELNQKQNRQIKQTRWFFGQERKRIK